MRYQQKLLSNLQQEKILIVTKAKSKSSYFVTLTFGFVSLWLNFFFVSFDKPKEKRMTARQKFVTAQNRLDVV